MNGISVQRTLAAPAIVAVLLWPAAQSPPRVKVQFTDVTLAAGITFQHANAASSKKYLTETMGSGAAWLDYDGDGCLDLYLVNSAASSALYHNNGDGTFTEVTEKVGVAAAGLFGMGVAAADFNNDGYPDLYVVGYSRSILSFFL
jgi:enediyne biosynthesis protein E4